MLKKNKSVVVTQKLDIENLAIKEPLNDMQVFIDFCNYDIQSATNELKTIKTEKNRKHLQKLVYVNLINRFDYLIDKLLLWLSINNEPLRNEILKSVEQETISRKEVFEIFFMKDRSYDLVIEKIRELTRNNLLRDRHSVKLHKIILKCLDIKDYQKPRVNKDGKIYTKIKKNKSQPNDIIGYADWLYSRRNSLVHGNGTNYNKTDYEYIKKHFQVNLSKQIKLKLTSITSAVNFYTDLIEIIKNNINESKEHSDEL